MYVFGRDVQRYCAVVQLDDAAAIDLFQFAIAFTLLAFSHLILLFEGVSGLQPSFQVSYAPEIPFLATESNDDSCA